MENIITVHAGIKGWDIEYHGQGADIMVAVFGTARVPTSFTHDAPADEVVRTIERLNPDYIVKLASH